MPVRLRIVKIAQVDLTCALLWRYAPVGGVDTFQEVGGGSHAFIWHGAGVRMLRRGVGRPAARGLADRRRQPGTDCLAEEREDPNHRQRQQHEVALEDQAPERAPANALVVTAADY